MRPRPGISLCRRFFIGYPLRHSHIWVSYGPVLSHVFISPAQHQIHHSRAVQHHDKNLGGAFALWDWLFGTLYVPAGREDLEFGLSNGHSTDYRQFWKLYYLPFQTNFKTIKGKVGVVLMLSVFVLFAVMALVR